MSLLMAIGMAVVLLLLNIILVYRHRATQQEHLANLHQAIADVSTSLIQQRAELDESVADLKKTHREETVHDSTPAHLAKHADFDNDWAGASGLPGQGPAAGHAVASAAAAGATGTAVDNIGRNDVSE